MKKEQRELVVRDLCARIPYGVMVGPKGVDHPEKLVGIDDDSLTVEGQVEDWKSYSLTWDVTPYLRPLSDMTEEEKLEYRRETGEIWEGRGVELSACHTDGVIVTPEFMWKTLCFLLKHHFDVNGLIGKGLAVKAPEWMYR